MARVVTDTLQTASGMSRSRALQIDVFPAPEGPDMTISRPRFAPPVTAASLDILHLFLQAINQSLGLRYVKAHDVQVGDKFMPNPYVERDSKGLVSNVYIKGALIGRAQNGNVCSGVFYFVNFHKSR